MARRMASEVFLGLVIRLPSIEEASLITSQIIENGGEIIYRTTAQPPTRLYINHYRPYQPLSEGKENEQRI